MGNPRGVVHGKLNRALVEARRLHPGRGIFPVQGTSGTATRCEYSTPKRDLIGCAAYCTVPRHGCLIVRHKWNISKKKVVSVAYIEYVNPIAWETSPTLVDTGRNVLCSVERHRNDTCSVGHIICGQRGNFSTCSVDQVIYSISM